MRIYGPFHALNNPFVMASLGMHALSDGLQLYEAYNKRQQQQFLEQTALTGQPATSIPGGPIRQGLSKLTGGLVSPDIKPDAETLLGERALVNQQQDRNLKQIGEAAKLRTEVGTAPFQQGGIFANFAKQHGLPADTFLQPTPQEQRLAEQIHEHDPNYLIPLKRQEAEASKQGALDAELNPANVQAQANAKATISATAAAAGERARESVQNAPASVAAAASKAYKIGAARKAGTDRQAQIDLDNTPIDQTQNMKTGGGIFVNTHTFKTATGAPGEPQTYGQAMHDPNYFLVPTKNIKDLNFAIASANQLHDEIRPLIYNKDGTPNTTIFPDTRGMNGVMALKALKTKGAENYALSSNDPNVQAFQRINTVVIGYIKNLNGRFPNTQEFNVRLLPDPGGLSLADDKSKYSFMRKVPIIGSLEAPDADSWQVAAAKYENIQKAVLDNFRARAGLTNSGISANTSDEDINKYADMIAPVTPAPVAAH